MLKDKTALVTGSGGGIGRAIALLFAREGAKVVLVGRTQSKIDETKDMVLSEGGEACSFPCSLENQSQVEAVSAEIMKLVGQVDILVNNAGVSREIPFQEMPFSVWQEMIDCNLYSAVLMTRAVLPGMLKRNSGCIINIASAAGMRGLPGSTAYSAAKAALIAFSQALGDELRLKGIRVNAICPGPVDTEMMKKSSVRDFLLKSGAALFEPEEVASSALFLASGMSGKMNSQILVTRDSNRW